MKVLLAMEIISKMHAIWKRSCFHYSSQRPFIFHKVLRPWKASLFFLQLYTNFTSLCERWKCDMPPSPSPPRALTRGRGVLWRQVPVRWWRRLNVRSCRFGAVVPLSDLKSLAQPWQTDVDTGADGQFGLGGGGGAPPRKIIDGAQLFSGSMYFSLFPSPRN